MTKNILATDFSQHFKNLEKFKQLITQMNEREENEDSRYVSCKNIIVLHDSGVPRL
mgnify:CR=1 FL=1